MSNFRCVSDAHLQVECKEFAFIVATNALYPRSDHRFVVITFHIDNQKEEAILSNPDALTKVLTLERVMHKKFVVSALQSVLKSWKPFLLIYIQSHIAEPNKMFGHTGNPSLKNLSEIIIAP